MTAEFKQHIDFALERLADVRAAHRLLESATIGLEAALSALGAAVASQGPSEPESPGEDNLEANPPFLGWKLGDPTTLQTMGQG